MCIHVGVRGQLGEVDSLGHLVCPRDYTQVVTIGDQHLHPPSHIVGIIKTFLRKINECKIKITHKLTVFQELQCTVSSRSPPQPRKVILLRKESNNP